MPSLKSRNDLEKLNELVSLKGKVKHLRLQDKLGKQNFHEALKKVFEPKTDTVKQADQEMIGAVKIKTKAIEIKAEEAYKAINKIGDFD